MTTDNTYRYEIWWCAAGCLYDAEHPAFVANTIPEIETWLAGPDADDYRNSTGEHSTYYFDIIDTQTQEDK